MDMLDLGKPDLDWVRLAGGMGVEGAQATTLEQCADLLVASFKHSAPFVIELLI
jgi:acetolactate synthase-1/2/3 large subunit